MISVVDITSYLCECNMNNPLEQAHFLAQADHESAGFTQLLEGSKYRFARALEIWPSRKTQILAKQTELKAHNMDFCPQPWLFNTVYGSRMGNDANGTADNDGFDTRGHGIFQLTGMDNRVRFLNWLNQKGRWLALTMAGLNSFLLTEEGAILSAIWFWQDKGCSALALSDDLTAVTRKINGGLNGLTDRRQKLIKYKKMLGV
ncbi:MAG: hypothetical protein E6Q33_02780 [Neisseriales bacterium]|nr:MAG: hypothetical protein E6Q33_02780 [Neisseriales bacterium]